MNKKFLSLFLALSLLIPLTAPLTAFATDQQPTATASAETEPTTAEASTAALPETAAPDAVSEEELLENCSILKFVDAETFRAAGHVARLPEIETLSSYAFRNADGTHTVYYLDQPVKYVDADGDFQTIDLTLQADGAVYRPVSNDLSLTLAKDYTDGVTLSHNGLSATLFPVPATEAPPLGDITETVMVIPRVSGESLTYENAFGAEIDLRYTVLYNGLKEDIILESYTGQSSFTFLLRTSGMTMYQANGVYYLARTADATERITLSSVVAYDKYADMCEGTMSVTTAQAGSLYEITVTVDSGWLQTDAEYPVSVDLTMLAEPYSADAILDAPVFNLKPTQNFGSYTYNRVGYYNSWGIGRTVVRPDGMLNSTLYKSLHASQVNSVLFTVTEATGSADQTIQIHKLYNGEDWTESDVTYDSMGFSCGVVTTAQLGNNAPTTFDLTSLVKEWINRTNIASNGFMMKGVNENTVNKAFCSTEFGTVSMRPFMTLNYTPITAVITPDDDFVKIGESVQFYCDITPSDIAYTWRVHDTSIATVSSAGVVTGVSQGWTFLTATWNGGSRTVTIKVGALEEGTYFIGNKQTGKYMDLEGAAYADGTPIQQWQFHGYIQSRWVIKMQRSGAYSIKSAYTGKYIGVENSSTVGGAAIKQYASIDDQPGREWYISQTSSGAYRFKPGTATHMALCVPLTGTYEDGTDLVQLGYTNNSDYRDEWVVVESGTTTFLAIPDTSPGHDHAGSFPLITQSVNAMGYGENYTYTSANTNTCIDMIASSDIFYSRSHGAQNGIVLSTNSLRIAHINYLEANALSKCNLVLYGACWTGLGKKNADNLVNATHAKGVTTVIGFETSVDCAEMNEWAKAFFEALADRKTVLEACEAADDAVSEYIDALEEQYTNTNITPTTIGHWYIAGSETQILHRVPLGGN